MKKGPSVLVRLTLYPFVAAVFLTVAFIVMLFAFGYDIGYENGKIVTNRTGIVIVSSNPGDAEVYVDGELHKDRTSTLPFFTLKLNRMAAGDYNIKVAKEGFIPWEGQVTVRPGFVSWRDYIILAPLEKEATPYNFPGNVEQTINSQDKGTLLVKAVDGETNIMTLWKIDTSTKSQTKIQEKKLKEDEDVKLSSISVGNDRYLYQEISGESKKYKVREMKENGESWDISGQFGVSFDSIVFSPYSHDKVYVIRDENLYEINFINRNMSASIAKKVVGVYPNETELLMVQQSEENYGLWRVKSDNDKDNIIKALPASKAYKASFMKDVRAYVVYVGDEKDLLVYKNEVQNPTIETIARNVNSYSVSPNEERIGYSTNNSYMVYDVHKEEYFVAINDKDIKSINWFRDSSNLLYLEDKELRMVNYDGFYDTPLFEALGTTPVITSRTNENIFFSSEATKDDLDIFVYSF